MQCISTDIVEYSLSQHSLYCWYGNFCSQVVISDDLLAMGLLHAKYQLFTYDRNSAKCPWTVHQLYSPSSVMWHGPLASYVKLQFALALTPGMPITFFPPPWVSDPDMHHDRCVTHVPWCMPGSLTVSFEVGGGLNVPGIPGAWATGNCT